MTEFWASPNVEPKRSYRFYLEINGIERWTVKRVKRPDFTMSEIAHEYINHKFWYPGRVDWSPVNVTLVDPVKPDNTSILLAAIYGSGYRLPIDKTPTMTPNKSMATSTLGNVSLYGLGGSSVAVGGPGAEGLLGDEAATIERWDLVNAWIKSVEFGDYSYSDDSIIDLSCTIRYDFAKYQVMKGNKIEDKFIDRAGSVSGVLKSVLTDGKRLIAGNG